MSENNKKYGEAWRAELMKWRKSEIIDFLKDTLVCNRIHQWHYPSKMENGKYIADDPIADFYPIEILAFYPDKRKYEIIKYDSSWMYYKRNGESLSNRTNFIWQYLQPPKEMKC